MSRFKSSSTRRINTFTSAYRQSFVRGRARVNMGRTDLDNNFRRDAVCQQFIDLAAGEQKPADEVTHTLSS